MEWRQYGASNYSRPGRIAERQTTTGTVDQEIVRRMIRECGLAYAPKTIATEQLRMSGLRAWSSSTNAKKGQKIRFTPTPLPSKESEKFGVITENLKNGQAGSLLEIAETGENLSGGIEWRKIPQRHASQARIFPVASNEKRFLRDVRV